MFTTGTFRLAAREAIAAGAGQLALAEARTDTRDTPHWQATLAAVEAMVGDDEDRWHEALRLSADHGLRLIAVDALEGLAVAAATSESWTECLRLSGAAERLRDETGYRWRFANEQAAGTKRWARRRTSSASLWPRPRWPRGGRWSGTRRRPTRCGPAVNAGAPVTAGPA